MAAGALSVFAERFAPGGGRERFAGAAESLTFALGSICFELLTRRCWLLSEQPHTQGCPKQLGGLCLCHTKARAGPAVFSLPVLSQGSKSAGYYLLLSLGWPDFVLPKMWRGVLRGGEAGEALSLLGSTAIALGNGAWCG